LKKLVSHYAFSFNFHSLALTKKSKTKAVQHHLYNYFSFFKKAPFYREQPYCTEKSKSIIKFACDKILQYTPLLQENA